MSKRTRCVVGRALGLIAALAVIAVGVAIIRSQFVVGWSGGRVNDGVTLLGLSVTAAGVVAVVLWLRTLLRERR